ncbi:hypothetical protein AB0J48_34760 [Nocardia salmonicida]|uniref:hypothetical protein n=1 Tax=Nocardia salmonicida TaxID=53431 RepID=UPI00343086FC
MSETGTVQVDHHQFLLSTIDADPTDATAEGTLIWTGPGFVCVLTGIANGPATLILDCTADTELRFDDWEAIEETVIETDSPLQVMSLDGDLTEHFLAIAAGRYRVRVHARGRDTHFDLGVTEPTETYLIQLTTTTSQFAGITRLHKIDDAHTVAVTAPTTKQRPQIDAEHIYLLNEGKTYAKVDRFGPEAYAFYARREAFGGRQPTGLALLDLSVKGAASMIAYLDRDLVDEVLALSGPVQQVLIRWCARQAFERAGLTAIPDFRTVLDALDAGATAPPDFANASLLGQRLDTDPQIKLTVVPGFEGIGDLIPQFSAIGVYMYAAVPAIEPWQTLTALHSALCTFGRDYPELIARIRREFLAPM